MITHEHDDESDHRGDHSRPVHSAERADGSEAHANLADKLVASSLRSRESNCSAGCASGGCRTGGCGVASLLEQIANNFEYDDQRHIVELTYRGYRHGFAEIAADGPQVHVHDEVLVESDRGIEFGTVKMTGSLVHARRRAKRLTQEEMPRVLRRASEDDCQRESRNRQAEREATSVCRTRIESFGLPMNLVEAEWQFDHRRITFYFTADGRVDFRMLVRDLASIFHTRIELRQIAVRDEAKRMGGMGICGKELCCTSYLGRYEHITLDHARAQQLQVNPTKLSGLCGRLKCCLLYELDNYVEGLRRFPPLESTLTTERGTGVVQKIDIFRDLVYVFHAGEEAWETVTLEELRALAARAAEPSKVADTTASHREHTVPGGSRESRRGRGGRRGNGDSNHRH